MARMRMLKPEFFLDEDIAKLPPLTRLAFQGLWCQADRAGRLEDRPDRLKVSILPYDRADMAGILAELERGRFIVRYEAGGRRYIQVRTFGQHQHPHIKEPASTIPAPDEHGASMVLAPTEHVASTPESESEYGVRSRKKIVITADAAIAPTEDHFGQFWDHYPRKVAKATARQAFKALHVTEPLLGVMLSALDRQRGCEQWLRDGGAFIPHAATWLRGKRWEDDVRPVSQVAGVTAKTAGNMAVLEAFVARGRHE